MEGRHLELADEYCRLVNKPDLLAALKLDATATAEQAVAALVKERRRMQGMQSNPKWKTAARFLIKHVKALEVVLGDPPAYLAHVRHAKEAESLGMLELAIAGILADGKVTAPEYKYVRESALSLGVSPETFEKVLRDKADEVGAVFEFERKARASQSDDGPATPGIKGTGNGWWDAAFSRLLLGTIPEGAGRFVDVYCRMAWSALTILPHRPDIEYVGIDRNPERLAIARSTTSAFGSRVHLTEGFPLQLPLQDESVDVVLATRAMQNLDDTAPVFHEAWRVLRPGGRMVVVEADGLSETFYFDAHLGGYNNAFHRAARAIDAGMNALRPDVPVGDRPSLALGPQLGARMDAAGLSVREFAVHSSQNLQLLPRGRMARRLRHYPRALARSVGLSDRFREMDAVQAAVDHFDRDGDPETMGMGGNVLPLFLWVGVKT